jgi:nitroimidazol reductase NimA-like FMN-containing flavoprotein (pyridoxamine 5'-phosphate oxidase superfamily)
MSLAKSVYRTKADDEEVAALLARREVAAFGTLNEDGSVHLTYVIFLFENGRFLIETASVTRKARNVAARGRATLLMSGPGRDGRNVMVSAEGRGRVLDGDEAAAAKRRILAKYLRPEALDEVDRAFSRFDDVAIEVVPERWRSWANTRLRDEAEAELGPGRYGEVWLD